MEILRRRSIFREGSISMPKAFKSDITDVNSKTVFEIEKHSQNTIGYTLDGVFDFMKKRKDYNPQYKVFKEYFVVCWAAEEKQTANEMYLSRVDIELINEQVRLFYSNLDKVSIIMTEHSFKIIEYVNLGLQDNFKHYPLEETLIQFNDNLSYSIDSALVFEAPQYDKKILHHIYNINNTLIERLKRNTILTKEEEKDLLNLPATYLICYLNLFHEAIDKLEDAKPY